MIEYEPTPETPKDYWRNICFYPIRIDDARETISILDDEPEIKRILGTTGIILATRIRKFPYGELADESGEMFDIKKTSTPWLICEASTLLESIQSEAAKTAPFN